jgi:Possible lysine decarboxylase
MASLSHAFVALPGGYGTLANQLNPFPPVIWRSLPKLGRTDVCTRACTRNCSDLAMGFRLISVGKAIAVGTLRL